LKSLGMSQVFQQEVAEKFLKEQMRLEHDECRIGRFRLKCFQQTLKAICKLIICGCEIRAEGHAV